MSEYQIVKFRAIDRPLTDKQMEFMSRQSSRAEFTKWEFEVEYQFSSFRGNVDGMLRNGYDVFLTYSNYSWREIRIRLPGGLPFPKSVWKKSIGIEGLEWAADKNGKAGILKISPYLEDSNGDVSDFDDYLDAAATLREMLIAGDPRALYVLWLCGATSSECETETLMEPPVPYGLGTLPPTVAELLEFFEADSLLVEAAAVGIPAFDAQGAQDELVKSWLASIADSRRSEIIQRVLSEDPRTVKAELQSEIQDTHHSVDWPVAPPTRTMAQLLDQADLLRKEEVRKQQKKAEAKVRREADKAEKQRHARLVEMRSSPAVWLKKASQLVEERGAENYRAAASILVDVREAVGGDQGSTIARKHAAHLAKSYPTLHVLKSSLRKSGLLD